MNQDQKFQQRWEFRRKDDDSSSEDSKSYSVDESVQKKHKIVSNLILSQKDEESDTPRSQQNSELDPSTGVHSQIVQGTKKRHASGKKGNAVQNESQEHSWKQTKKKRKVNRTQEPALFSDLKIFTESLLEELKVARDKMLLEMKEQIKKVVTGKSASRTSRKKGSCLPKAHKTVHQNGNISGAKIRSHFNGFRGNFKKGNEQVTKATREKGEKLSLPVKKPRNLANDSDQTVATPYFTLPSILSKPQSESLRTDFSLIDANNHHGYLLGIQQDEQYGSSSQIISKNRGFFDQQGSQASDMSGLPVQLHQWPNNCFNITSQIVLENPGQGNSAFGLRMNAGAIRFPGRSHSLLDNFVNSISINMNNTNGDHMNPK